MHEISQFRSIELQCPLCTPLYLYLSFLYVESLTAAVSEKFPLQTKSDKAVFEGVHEVKGMISMTFSF